MKYVLLVISFILSTGCADDLSTKGSSSDYRQKLQQISDLHSQLAQRFHELADMVIDEPSPSEPDSFVPADSISDVLAADMLRPPVDLFVSTSDVALPRDSSAPSQSGCKVLAGFDHPIEYTMEYPGNPWDNEHSRQYFNRESPSGWTMKDNVYTGWINGRVRNDQERRLYPMLKSNLETPVLITLQNQIRSFDVSGSQWAHLISTFHREWDNFSVTLIPGPRLDMTGGITDLVQHSSRDLPIGKWFEVALWVEYGAGGDTYRAFVDGRLVLTAPKSHSSRDKIIWQHYGVYATESVTNLIMDQRSLCLYRNPTQTAINKWGR